VKLVVGLGNPGKEYERTPHNAGFRVVDRLADRLGIAWRRSLRFECLLGQGDWRGVALVVLKPLTFMNLSGRAVSAVSRYRGVERTDIVVVSDDADLDLGRLRVRSQGGSGGHRGLVSLIEMLGGGDFVRVRVGIGRRGERDGLTDHVLGRFGAEDLKRIEPAYERAVDAVLCAVECGAEVAMNRFNAAADEPDPATRAEMSGTQQ
jgi:PTH1 family peptidyl-tRNA hydrolase